MPRTTKGTGGRKRYPLNMRTTKETRDRLEAAAIASGRSLVQEVEARLERSFHQETALGGPEMARVAFLMAASFAVAVGDSRWTDDPLKFGNGVAAVLDALLRGFPQGPEKKLAIEAIASRVLTRLEQEKLAHPTQEKEPAHG
jgi:Arc-like DNA binding domain